MKLTISNFHNYEDAGCQTVKRAVDWAIDKSFTYEELCENFPDAKYLNYFLKYLKPEYCQDFFDCYLKPETIENYEKLKECNSLLQSQLKHIERREKELSKKLDTIGLFEDRGKIVDRIVECEEWMNKSDVIYILSRVSEGKYNSGNYYSSSKRADSMQQCLYSLIQSVEFKPGDFKYISTKNWFCFDREYRRIISARNYSAIKDFEKCFDFKPFILNGRRMYLDISIRVVIDNEWTKLRCTCFEPVKDKIRFVTDNGTQAKQKRYCFTHEEFKEFFKDREIDSIY
jgi:hypothetical protein